jgi:hypothetical protein
MCQDMIRRIRLTRGRKTKCCSSAAQQQDPAYQHHATLAIFREASVDDPPLSKPDAGACVTHALQPCDRSPCTAKSVVSRQRGVIRWRVASHYTR